MSVYDGTDRSGQEPYSVEHWDGGTAVKVPAANRVTMRKTGMKAVMLEVNIAQMTSNGSDDEGYHRALTADTKTSTTFGHSLVMTPTGV